MLVSIPNWAASYDVTTASASKAALEATYGPRNGGVVTMIVLPT
jgi:hypothetical protein